MPVTNEMQELLKSAAPLKPHHKAYIEAVSVLSGSVAFGVAGANPDKDYVLRQKQFDGMGLGMDVLRYGAGEPYRFDGYSSWYVKCENGEVFNLLVAETEDVYNQYVFATVSIKDRMAMDAEYAERIKDKAFRVSEFQKFKKECVG